MATKKTPKVEKQGRPKSTMSRRAMKQTKGGAGSLDSGLVFKYDIKAVKG